MLMIKISWGHDEIAAATCETCRRNNLAGGHIRLMVTYQVAASGCRLGFGSIPRFHHRRQDRVVFGRTYIKEGLAIVTVGYTPNQFGRSYHVIIPAASQDALKGITRSSMIGYRRYGAAMTRCDTWNAGECFLTGTPPRSFRSSSATVTRSVRPKPRSVTHSILQAFRRRVLIEGSHV